MTTNQSLGVSPRSESAQSMAGLPTKPPRRFGRYAATFVAAILGYYLASFLITSDGMHWDVVREFMFSDLILQGVWLTVWLTAVSMVLALVLGTVIAVARMSTNPLPAVLSALFVWFFRGTPLLVQLIFWFNLGALTPTLSVKIPFGPTLASGATNDLIGPLTAALLGLVLNEAAYMAEIVRGGLAGVDLGQTEAASALGMPKALIFRRIVMPQAMSLIVPPTSNELINLLKATSLVSVITLSDLMFTVQTIYAQSYQVIPLLIVASLWYLVLVTVLSVCQDRVEKRFGRGSSRTPPVPLWTRLVRNVRSMRHEKG